MQITEIQVIEQMIAEAGIKLMRSTIEEKLYTRLAFMRSAGKFNEAAAMAQTSIRSTKDILKILEAMHKEALDASIKAPENKGTEKGVEPTVAE